MKRRSFLQALSGGIVGIFAPMALAPVIAGGDTHIGVDAGFFGRDATHVTLVVNQSAVFCAKLDADTNMWEFFELGRGPASPDTWCGALTEEYLVESGSTVERELRMLAGYA